MRRNVEFSSSDGITLRGWLQTPDSGSGKFPLVVMAHGLSAVKELFLDRYADIFSAAGLACLVYDHRNFGASAGEPRLEVDPWLQVKDYREAITFAALQPEVDRTRIGIWGTSFSGGHVIPVAALDKRVKCVVSQVPFMAGLRNAQRVFREEELPLIRAHFDADREARFLGKAPEMLPVFGERGSHAALPSPEEWEFMQAGGLIGTPLWLNQVTLRSAEMMMEYEPISFIQQVSPTPLLMIVVTADIVTPTDIALEAYQRALEPKKLLLVKGGHMEVYANQFELGAHAARDWLAQHLGVD
ncbi:MAG: Acetylxylan esterase [Nevskia sp.]|nr:Acetylxylan esterase [Nevskia sp.]